MSEAIRKVSTIFTINDSEHNKKLKEINAQYKLTQSEIKLAGERLNQFGKNTTDLTYKQEALIKQTKTLEDKINLYKNSIEKASNTAQKNNDKLNELKETKAKLSDEYKNSLKLYDQENKKLAELEDNLKFWKERLEEVREEQGENSSQTQMHMRYVIESAKAVKQKKASLEELSNTMQENKEALDKCNAAYQEQKAVVDKNVKTINTHKTKLTETEAQLTKVKGELKKTSEELDKQNSKWIKTGESLKEAGEKLSTFGDKASKIGSALTKTITLPVIAAGTAAIKSAIDFESAFAGVKKTIDGTDEDFEKLEEGIKQMSKEIPSTAEDIAAVAEAAGQLGIQKENVLSFSRTIIDLGNATNLVGEEGASQLAKFANITQMSQKDFDKLGSSIVALGNKMATTEADIVSMAMRLAGAGKQVGMSEADIMSFAAALSSVGIEAEAGGSAFSKVMLEIQMAVQSGSESIGDFANVAGMSFDEFSDKFKNDATGALIAFIEGLGKLENKATVLDELGFSEIRVRDALLRASSAGDLFNKSIQIGSEAWKENTALTNEANQRYATTESQIAILKNEIIDMAREIGVELLPTVKDGLIIVKDLIDKFNKLSPATKENIIKFAAFSAALGPVLGGVGTLAKVFGGVLKFAGKLSTGLGAAKVATAGVGTAAATAGGTAGLTGLATSLGGVVVAAAPYLAAGAAIAGVGYAIYKGVTKEANPALDLFADKVETTYETINAAGAYGETVAVNTVTKISEATKNAVGAYLELSDGAKNELQNLYVNSTVISEQIKTDVSSKFGEMSNQIISGYETQKTQSMTLLQEMFNEHSTLTAQGQAEVLNKTEMYYTVQTALIQGYENSIYEIIDKASQEKRTLTQDEVNKITELQNLMRDNAVKALSENEIEAQIILQRMKDYDGQITKEQASEHIKALNASRDEAVRIANDEYEKRLAEIIRLRDEAGTITADQAEKMIQDAKDQRDGIVEEAENTRVDALDKMRELNSNLDEEVDTGTGNVLGIWGKLKRWWSDWQPETKTFNSVQYTERMTGNRIGTNALGTSYFQGGLTAINEKGYEIVELPRGSKVKNHLQSENMIKDTAIQTAKAIAASINADNSNNIEVRVYLGEKEIIDKTTKEVVKSVGRTVNNHKKGKGGLAFA